MGDVEISYTGKYPLSYPIASDVKSYSLSQNYFEVSLNGRLSDKQLLLKKGDFVTVRINDKVLFEGWVEWAIGNSFKLINPLVQVG